MKYLLFGIVLFWACQPEKTVYVEVPVEAEPEEVILRTVKANVTRTSNTTVNGVKYVTASGKVVNQGPGSVHSVRIVLTSDAGYSKTVSSSPSALAEDEWGDWSVSGLQGSYIKFKDALFSTSN